MSLQHVEKRKAPEIHKWAQGLEHKCNTLPLLWWALGAQGVPATTFTSIVFQLLEDLGINTGRFLIFCEAQLVDKLHREEQCLLCCFLLTLRA